MRNVIINQADCGQRLDKYLLKYMPNATKGFIYKMLRKKNIKLNNAKAIGNEMLSYGDCIALYLSEETINSFAGNDKEDNNPLDVEVIHGAVKRIKYDRYRIEVIYEDENIILLGKPAGLLSQKASPSDISLVEILESYVKLEGRGRAGNVQKPGIVNRLDRNTSGLVACGKTLKGLQELSAAVKEKRVKKFYRCIVKGRLDACEKLTGYLVKDEKANRVKLVDNINNEDEGKADYIETAYETISCNDNFSYLSVELITGKTHQIRAHLASIGHPLAGDVKYGAGKEKGMAHFFLHSYELAFGKEDGVLKTVSGKTFQAPLPKEFKRYCIRSR